MLTSDTTTISTPTTITGACSLSGTAVLVVDADLTLASGCLHSVRARACVAKVACERVARQDSATLQVAAGVTVTSNGGQYAWSGGSISGAGTVTFNAALAISGSVSLGVSQV